MQRHSITGSLAALVLAATAAAQTSPAGFDAIEGNDLFVHWTSSSRRFQQVDASQIGTPRVVFGLAWRRNGEQTQTSAVARTFDLSVEMGHTSFALLSGFFDDNYFAGTRTVVLPATPVSFPSWNAFLPGPTPFDFSVVLSAPFAYNGVDALVIDLTFRNAMPAGAANADREFNGFATLPDGTALGTGCTVTGRPTPFAHSAQFMNLGATPTPDWGMRLRLSGSHAPPSSPIVAHVDILDQNLAGFLCGTIHALPGIVLPMRSGPSGLVHALDFGFPHDPTLANVTLYTQLFADDAGQAPLPIAVSNGRESTMPAVAAFPNAHRTAYSFYAIPGPGAFDGGETMWVGGGMVMLLQ